MSTDIKKTIEMVLRELEVTNDITTLPNGGKITIQPERTPEERTELNRRIIENTIIDQQRYKKYLEYEGRTIKQQEVLLKQESIKKTINNKAIATKRLRSGGFDPELLLNINGRTDIDKTLDMSYSGSLTFETNIKNCLNNNTFVIINGGQELYIMEENPRTIIATLIANNFIYFLDYDNVQQINYAELVNNLSDFNNCEACLNNSKFANLLFIADITKKIVPSQHAINQITDILQYRKQNNKPTILSFAQKISKESPILNCGVYIEALTSLNESSQSNKLVRFKVR